MTETGGSAEIVAMGAIEAAFEGLDEDTRARVLRWASDRYRVRLPKNAAPDGGGGGDSDLDDGKEKKDKNKQQFDTVADLYNAASPTSDPDRALVVSYWFQFIKGDADIDSQSVNTELKHLGHGVGNITQAFAGLIARKPQLVIQTKKEGKTQQARKKYRVTQEGKKAVDAMLQSQVQPG